MKAFLHLLSLLVLLVFQFGTFPCWSFDQKKYKIPNHADWMSNLRDDTPVRLVSIPGAHDAATGTVNLAGTSCQNMNINDLFDAGVRYFDFRVGFTAGTELRMYHGPIDVSRTFKGVMNDLYKKLEDHPKEFVIVEVTIESATNQKSNAADHLTNYFRHDYDKPEEDVSYTYWDSKANYEAAKSKWLYFRPELTVEEVRGHMILLFNDKYCNEENMQGPFIPGRGDGPGCIRYIDGYNSSKELMFHTPLHCQNNYHSDPFEKNVMLKFYDYVQPEIEQFTQVVQQNPDSVIFCMNFLSGYIDKIPNQYVMAGPVNALFAQYVNQHPECYLGIVMMDYCGTPIYRNMTSDTVNGDIALEAIINNNRRFWNYEQKKDRREPIEMQSN